MSKSHQLTKKQLTKIFFSYGLHLWIMVFVINIAVFYVARYYSFGKTCLTPTQVQTDNRCLYIMSGKVYEKGTRNSPHQGHPCGTDVTSVIPPSHVGNPSMYLLPNNVGDICAAPQPPTPTPQPKPTNTPIPTPLPQPTAVPQQTAAQPTSPFAARPQVPTVTLPVIPTPTTAQSVAAPTPAVATPTGNIYTSLPVTTISAPLTGPGIAFSFAIPGIEHAKVPIHKTKAVTLNVYAETLNAQDSKIAPTYTVSTEATYDDDPASPTNGLFVVPRADLGNTVPAGAYRIAFRTNQIPLTLLKVSDTEAQGTVFHLTPGNLAPEKPSAKDILVGDLNTDNIFNIQDYSIFVDCYGTKISSTTCLAPNAVDLNDDGAVDGVDYILMLQSIKRALTLGKAEIISPTSAPLPTLQTKQITPTVASASPTVAKSVQKPSPTIRHIISKISPKTPTPTTSETLVNGSSVVTFSQIITYVALLLVVFVAVFGAFKSRLFNSLLHAKRASEPAPEQAVVQSDTAAAPVVAETPAPPVKKQISRVYFITNTTQTTPDGKFILTLTDDAGAVAGYTNQTPPTDGYYTVSGFEETQDGVVSISILTMTPALKPGTNF